MVTHRCDDRDMTAPVGAPSWVDLGTADVEDARRFYTALFGWTAHVSGDEYGGYTIFNLHGRPVAGAGPLFRTGQPTAWSTYIATDDADADAVRVVAAGGKVLVAPFDVGDQGRMAVFQDPSGAFISAWQGTRMGGFQTDAPNAFGWAELNARGIDMAIPFYTHVFGWQPKQSEMGEGQPPYTEFQLDGRSVAGGWEMNPMVPPEVPSYWQVYFDVDDVDAAHARALELGAHEMLGPQDFPGGRFSIVSDPQGASFGLLKMAAR
jgi:predicted enzyme related to lactoylglutathione lyase